MTTYEVSFTVELEAPPQDYHGILSGDHNLELISRDFGYLYIPADASVIELKPIFEPGYYIDMSCTDEEREEMYGPNTPRTVSWLDYNPSDDEDHWVRVNVTDRNF